MDERMVRYFDRKKFMWDGEEYAGEDDAGQKQEEYRGKDFEVQMVPYNGKHLIYTRRVVTEVVVEGAPM
ncbi:MAG: hypothetical protein KAU35_03285 [candidate division Zixibacteria bacterium]|nr:hypothetical protein [candidate division Zixibacteria bacterium]